jgi:hypothetical protein
VETTPKNIQFGISYYTDDSSIRGQPLTFTIFSKSVLCDKVGTMKRVSVQHHWALSEFNQSLMEFIRFTAERGNWNEKKNGGELLDE